ncbi:MAG TPA: hypothetical protein VNG12_22290, partial [Acidimicrobiales bacterium]|nr:hypothetical protein [Acidimicrobiales bacterium]
MKAVVDNDILYKILCYGIASQAISLLGEPGTPIGLLSASRYVVAKKIQTEPLTTAKHVILAEL